MSRRQQRMVHALGACAAALVLVSTLVLAVEPSASATPGSQLWANRYGSASATDIAYAVAVSPDGSKVFVTGLGTGSTSDYDYDYATAAYDASTGAQLWAQRYNGPGNGDDYATALGVSPEGSKVFVTGYSTGSTGYRDYVTVAYDASTGAKLWLKRYNGPGNGNDAATALGVSPDGSQVFVTGASAVSRSAAYATVAYDASTGAKLWAKRYTGPVYGRDFATALGVSPDGSKVFVTGSSGSSYGSTTGLDYATVAYDASTGAKLWLKRYNGLGNSRDGATALGVSPDGSQVFVTGSSITGSGRGYDYATVAYDASTGAQLWSKLYDGPGSNGGGNADDAAYALGVSPDGSQVFVTGYSIGSGSGIDYATVAYDASTGAQLWANRYNGPGNSYDFAFALGVSPDGSKVFVTGRSAGSTSGGDWATVAYSVA